MISIFAAAIVHCSFASALPVAFHQAPATPSSAGAAVPALADHANLWPQDITSNGKTYRVFQPRVTGLDGARAYLVTQVSMTAADGKTVTGEARLKAEMLSADIPGEVELNQFAVVKFTVDGKPAADADRTALSQALYVVAITTTRTNLLQGMSLVNARNSSTPGLNSAAPAFMMRDQPSVLVSVDGEPRFAPLGASGWMSVTNTAFILLKSPQGQWWTRVGGAWQSSTSLNGPYALAQTPPPADVTAAVGKRPAAAASIANTPPLVKAPALKPAVAVVVTRPTVLIAIDGAPVLADVCPGVQQVKNTNSILLTIDGNSFYVLAAGRWFVTTALGSGAWSALPPWALPAAFTKLPGTRRFDGARAAIPGTIESNEATLAAREIRTVTLNRAGAQPKFSVAGGMPKGDVAWQTVAGTTVQWLPSATQPVMMVGEKIYCCESGAWFIADALTGPWSLCDTLPAAISTIPPVCPIYACSYVWIFGSTPENVTFGFSPGYLGTYLIDGTPVYGTGFAYEQVPGTGYVAYPQTYAADCAYDSQTGTFSPPDDPNDDYAFYGGADIYPAYLSGDGWGGFGWCSGWNVGWATGWDNWWGWNHWGWWVNQSHPYYNRWAAQHADWEKQDLQDARARISQRNKSLDARTWPAARGSMAKAGKTDIRSAATSKSRTPDPSPEAARENQAAIDKQFQGAAGDAPAAFRGPGNEYGYPSSAYRSWTGTGSNLGGNWGYSPLASPNGFHPSQQFADPGAYWGSDTRLGNNVGPNAGPYHSPQGHGGWGTYDHWAGEGVYGTEYGRR